MTKEKLAFNIAEILKWGFPKADDTAHEEMERVALQIAGWIEEFVEAKISMREGRS